MNQDHFEIMLNDYVDGDLNPEEIRAFEKYLELTPEARMELEALLRLKNDTNALARNVHPPKELWEQIASKIEVRPVATVQNNNRYWRIALPLAASFLLALGLAYQVQNLDNSVSVQLKTQIVAPTPEMPQAYLEAVAEYKAARVELVDALEERLDTMSPKIRATVQENITVISGAVEEIRLALESNPDDSNLMWLLVATQKKELRFLEELLNLPAGA